MPLHQLPNQLRWDPFELDKEADWLSGMRLLGGSGSPISKSGLGILIFAVGKSMPEKTAFYSSDGDFLIVLQHGTLDIQTELGHILVRPNEIAVIPRGIKYRTVLPSGPTRGYILELYQGHFKLPELGPIGSNCLANPRDFQVPHAKFDRDYNYDSKWTVLNKFNGQIFYAEQDHTPFDVVAWHGSYYPYVKLMGRLGYSIHVAAT